MSLNGVLAAVVRRPRALLPAMLLCTAQAAAAPAADYAESVMIHALDPERGVDLSLRLARRPDAGEAEVWLHLADPRLGAWSLADPAFRPTGPAVTAVAAPAAAFTASGAADQWLAFEAAERGDAGLVGRVRGRLHVAATRDPELGRPAAGEVLTVDLRFAARSGGLRRGGRWELVGRLAGRVRLGDATVVVDTPLGKWHEQTGPRPGFAPAFTYLNVLDETRALLAIRFEDRAVGYLERDGAVTAVTAMEVSGDADSDDAWPRTVRVQFADGSVLEGRARRLERWSVPIEGVRRPGASIALEAGGDVLHGSLNDWRPPLEGAQPGAGSSSSGR